MSKTLEELQGLKTRLETDLRRSRMIDPDGITRNSPLFRNLEQVKREIVNFVPEKKTEVISEEKK